MEPPKPAGVARLGVGRLGALRMGFTLETFVAYVNAQRQETNARLQAADARQQATDAQLEEVRARLDAYERQRADRRPKLQRGGRTTGRKRRAKARADARTIPSRIADIKQRGRATTDKAAARVYLAELQPKAWAALTDTERKKRVDAFVRRLNRLRKTSDS